MDEVNKFEGFIYIPNEPVLVQVQFGADKTVYHFRYVGHSKDAKTTYLFFARESPHVVIPTFYFARLGSDKLRRVRASPSLPIPKAVIDYALTYITAVPLKDGQTVPAMLDQPAQAQWRTRASRRHRKPSPVAKRDKAFGSWAKANNGATLRQVDCIHALQAECTRHGVTVTSKAVRVRLHKAEKAPQVWGAYKVSTFRVGTGWRIEAERIRD